MDITSLKAHLTDELYTQVADALKGVDGLTIISESSGDWVPKSRILEEQSKQKDLNKTIASLNQQLTEAKKAGESVTTLQATIDALKQQVADKDTAIAGIKRSGKIREALSKAKARDAAVVEKLLDASKIGEDDKGNLTGLDDQVKALKESSAYLFAEDEGSRGGFGGGKPGGGNPGGSGNAGVNAAIRAAAGYKN